MTKQEITVFITKMHPVTLAITEEGTIATSIFFHPIAVTEWLEAFFPYLHKVVLIDIPLMKITPDTGTSRLMRFGLWIMFGIAISPEAIAIHSSTIECEGRAVLFLGESGTGKSTHTRLWQEHIPGARLLNDDSPIIRMYQGQATAFGSPWSGKTPCYRNISRPIAGIVRLSQAPANEITRLSILRAVGSLLPSCPPAFAYDSDLQDRICRTLSDILTQAPVWHLACLPDKAAAELSYATVLEGKQRA